MSSPKRTLASRYAFGTDLEADAERAATACRVWSSGVLPMPPQEKTTSPEASVAGRFRSAGTVVAEVLDPGEAQAAGAEHSGDLREMPCLPLAGKNLVADDDRAKFMSAAFLPRPLR